LVVVEPGPTSFGAYVPDLPGCVAVGGSRDEVLRLIHEAVESHLEGMRAEGRPIPVPASQGGYVEVVA
jgi:predicted RNase H-like HicB family nuclease